MKNLTMKYACYLDFAWNHITALNMLIPVYFEVVSFANFLYVVYMKPNKRLWREKKVLTSIKQGG